MGAIIAIATGLGSLPFGIPGLAFAGGLLSILLVWGLSGVTGERRTDRTLLAGIVVNAFFGALIMFLVSVTGGEQIHGILFWLMGIWRWRGRTTFSWRRCFWSPVFP